MTGKSRCLPWWTDSSGTHRGRRNHLCRRSCNKCSPSRVAWDTRCDRLLAVPTPLAGHRVPRHHQAKDTAHHFDLVATIPRWSVSAAVRWDMDGWSDRSDGPQETKYRPGPDPHWPVCHRFGPRFIITRHLRSSFEIFICLLIPWGINHYLNYRTFSSASISLPYSGPGRFGEYGIFAGRSTVYNADHYVARIP